MNITSIEMICILSISPPNDHLVSRPTSMAAWRPPRLWPRAMAARDAPRRVRGAWHPVGRRCHPWPFGGVVGWLGVFGPNGVVIKVSCF